MKAHVTIGHAILEAAELAVEASLGSPPPRTLGRRRLSRGTARERDSARVAHPRGRRRLRGDDGPPPVSGPRAGRRGARRARAACRRPVRPPLRGSALRGHAPHARPRALPAGGRRKLGPDARADARRLHGSTGSSSERKASTTSGSNSSPAFVRISSRAAFDRHRRAVRLVVRHRVERVRDREDARGERDLRAAEAARIARAHPSARGGRRSPGAPSRRAPAPARRSARRAMDARGSRRARPAESGPGFVSVDVRDADHADVVQPEPVGELRVEDQLGRARPRPARARAA